ncbi:MAG: hypothetical protein JNM52_03625 [Betaproteobacteria bacterium]|nr:hypothetical protein [Betaproteobacteria bacterium]
MKSRLLCPLIGLLALCTAAHAQEAKPSDRPTVYGLVSAVGDQFTFVRQRQQVGSHIENFSRKTVAIPGDALNAAVLRGLDKAIAKQDANSKRVFLTLNAAEMKGVLPQDREAVAIGKIVKVLETLPQRQEWDKIIVATPKWLFTEREGMASKLQGFGVYIQPLQSGTLDDDLVGGVGGTDLDQVGGSATIAPDGTRSTSKRYAAPFAYLQVYTLDAKTLTVLDKSARHDFQKLFDPNSTALDVGKMFEPEYLAGRLEKLVENTAQRAVLKVDALTDINIGDIKKVPADK